MLRNSTFLAVSVILMFLSGCVQSDSLVDNGDEDPEQIPFELTFSADTLDRAEDTDKRFDLKDELSNGPVMLLWIGAGCTGCHDWTDMIRQKMLNGELDGSNYTIVSVHRWGEFESTDELHEVFGNAEQSDHYTPWKIVTLLNLQKRTISTAKNPLAHPSILRTATPAPPHCRSSRPTECWHGNQRHTGPMKPCLMTE